MTWSKLGKDFMKAVLVLLALAAAFVVWTGVLSLARHASCDRLDA